MVTRDFSGEDVYTVLVNVGNVRHVRTSGSHVIVEWTPPPEHDTEPDGSRFRCTTASTSARYGVSAIKRARTTSTPFASGSTGTADYPRKRTADLESRLDLMETYLRLTDSQQGVAGH